MGPMQMTAKRRAVITGLGIVCPIGIGIDTFWAAASSGKSGVGPLTLFDGSKLPAACRIVGEVPGFNYRDWMPGRAGRMASRYSHFAVAAATMARRDSRLETDGPRSEEVKVAFGSSMSGLVDVQEPTFQAFLRGEGVWPWACLEFPTHAATSHIAIRAGARGQTISFATACAAGLDAIGWAAEQVTAGQASAVIAGAAETPLSPYSLAAFESTGVLSSWQGPPAEASRPFDGLRAGLVLAEAAAAVVVEDEDHARTRGAHIYAHVLGFASAAEGAHLRKVDESGQTIARAMQQALSRAVLTPGDIDYICAHGNSMQDYDVAETAGIKKAFGRYAFNIPISSPKSMYGHALAASGPMSVVTACLALRHGLIPPTINYQVPDLACNLDYVPNIARTGRLRTVLIHSHSLGGSHAVLVLGTRS